MLTLRDNTYLLVFSMLNYPKNHQHSIKFLSSVQVASGTGNPDGGYPTDIRDGADGIG